MQEEVEALYWSLALQLNLGSADNQGRNLAVNWMFGTPSPRRG